ncbi:MAG: hypothetical protein ACPG47_10940 [Leucothrix sp.]
MTMRKLGLVKNSLLTSLSLFLFAPAVSQAVELVEEVGDYQIVKVEASKVCFATYNGQSSKDKKVSFATYKTKYGDRWQVAGYVDHEALKTKGDLLSISFDKQHLFSRGVEFSKGKFALPFTEDDDLKNFTKLVESKATLELTLRNMGDTIVITLPELAKARAAIDKCLEGIEIKS